MGKIKAFGSVAPFGMGRPKLELPGQKPDRSVTLLSTMAGKAAPGLGLYL
jgi:hypothetical protein